MEPAMLGHAVYRSLLEAMSRPGSIVPLPPQTRQRPLYYLLDALLDHEVTFHFCDGAVALAQELGRSTGSRQAALPEADFVLFPDGRSDGHLDQVKRGTLEYPDTGATAIYCVRRLEPTAGRAVLRGPGIREPVSPRIEGLDEQELELLRQVNGQFPLGVDAVFLDEEGNVLCIPRSTRIEVR